MTSIIKLHAISGGTYDTSPPCYLLQVDDFKILLDCGWDEKFDQEIINELTNLVPIIDVVLLSHPDAQHLGCLPYLVGKCNLNCPIYATSPVCKMGEMFMYDLHQSRHNYEEFELFTLDDIDLTFEKIIQLKYNQSLELKGSGHGIVITPLPSGHMIGGTIWKIVKDNEESIIYAVDYNHKKERHLNGFPVENIITRPSLLITDCYNANYQQERRKERDEQLMTNILSTFRNNGNVLVAVDTAGRVLELSHMLDQLWKTTGSGLSTYSLAMLNTVSYNVIEFAKSQIEWMSEKIIRSFDGHRSNPFNFKHLRLIHSINDLEKINKPVVVLASQADLECGFARELFINWCSNPKNSIILTQRTYNADTLTSKLIEISNLQKKRANLKKEKDMMEVDIDKDIIELEIKKRIPLEGNELIEYNENLRNKLIEESNKLKKDNYDTDDDDDDDVDDPNDLLIDNKNDIIKQDEFFKKNLLEKKNYPIYPLIETKMKWDEYGEIVNPKDFLIFEKTENNETDNQNENNEHLLNGKLNNEVDDIINEIPTKCISSLEKLIIFASITFIDFEGRSDGESIKKIIKSIKPRRLIIVRGDEEATEEMRNYFNENLTKDTDKLFTPKRNEIVDATTERNIYQVKLKDSLVSSLKFSKAKDGAELCWLESTIELEKENDDTNEQDKIITLNRKQSNLPTLRPVEQSEQKNHMTIFINEIKLSDFKQVLVKNGIQAEFHSGVLYVNNKVCVRRNEAGRINLEGTICEDYFKVRKLLYEQYAVI